MISESTMLENRYFDSVFLMRVSKRLSEQPGINYAALVMGTPKNMQILADAGYDGIDALGASSNDLVVTLKADSADEARLVLEPNLLAVGLAKRAGIWHLTFLHLVTCTATVPNNECLANRTYPHHPPTNSASHDLVVLRKMGFAARLK